MSEVTSFLEQLRRTDWFDEKLPGIHFSSNAIKFLIGSNEFSVEQDLLVLRLFYVAIFIEDGIDLSVNTDLFKQNKLDVESLRAHFGYPSETDLVNYLFNSSQSIAERDGEYIAVYKKNGLEEVRLIEIYSVFGAPEKSSVTERGIEPASDLFSSNPRIFECTRRFQLQALNSTIVASKIAATLENINHPVLLVHARIIICIYLKKIFRADKKSIGYLTILEFKKLKRQVVHSSLDVEFKELVLSYIKSVLPGLHFELGRFEKARDLYSEIAKDINIDNRCRDHALWASTTCLLGVEVQEYLDECLSVREMLPVEFQMANDCFSFFVGKDIEVLIGEVESDVDNFDFSDDIDWILLDSYVMTVFKNTALYTEAINYFLLRLKYSIDLRKNGLFTDQGKIVLQELTAFLRDVFYVISFEVNSFGEWQPVPASASVNTADFLHHMDREGRLVDSGRVELHEKHPYGMSHPEEDLATVGHAYGIGLNANCGNEISEWVKCRLHDDSQETSLRPFVKLVWVEWFCYAFNSDSLLSFDIENFNYRAYENSGLTSLEQVETFKSNCSEAHLRNILSTFCHARCLLEELFPAKIVL